MADAGSQDFSTILGPDANFRGELSFEKGLRLQGRLEGKISTPGRVHVAKEGKMQADVEAGSVIVEGEVRGNLTATERIELKQSARYEGDLRASKLVVDEGAVFSGNVTVGPDAVKNRPQGAGAAAGAGAGGPSAGTGAPRPSPAPVGAAAAGPQPVR